MHLLEFFNVPKNNNQKNKTNQGSNLDDDLFWFILDSDKLYKNYFFPIARRLKDADNCSEETVYELFMPMVVDGCKEYYLNKKLSGKLGKKFPSEMREELCKRLYDHYSDNIKKGEYKLE
jgi:hypothetical protein